MTSTTTKYSSYSEGKIVATCVVRVERFAYGYWVLRNDGDFSAAASGSPSSDIGSSISGPTVASLSSTSEFIIQLVAQPLA